MIMKYNKNDDGEKYNKNDSERSDNNDGWIN